MTLPQLAYIVAVDDFKSFQEAAKHKFVTQPTLSMQVQKLEEELGVILFDRSRYPIKSTAIGQKVIEQARIVLEETAKIEELINYETTEIQGTFRLGIIPTIAPYLLPLFLETFVTKYPELDIVLDENQTGSLIDKLRRDELDAAIIATPSEENDLKEIPLYYEPFAAYVSKKHRLFKNKTINPAELELKDMFLLKEGHCFREHVINICKGYKDSFERRENSINFEGGTLDTLMKLVENNFGMTIIPFLLSQELAGTSKEKFIRPFEKPLPTREISIVHRKIFLKKNIVEVLRHEILNFIPENLKMNKNKSVVKWKRV